MAGIGSMSALLTAAAAEELQQFIKTPLVDDQSVSAGFWYGFFSLIGNQPNGTWGAARALDNTTTGALPLRARSSGKRAYLTRASFMHRHGGNGPNRTSTGTLVLFDRLVDCGNIDPSLVTTQTVGTPTLPTRLNNANGADCEAFVETIAGTAGLDTSCIATVAYTDSAGNAQTSSVNLVMTALNSVMRQRMFPIPTAAGAAPGFKSIESITLNPKAGTSAGNRIGLSIGRRIGMFPPTSLRAPYMFNGPIDTAFAPIHDAACVWMTLLNASVSATNSPAWSGVVGFVEEP